MVLTRFLDAADVTTDLQHISTAGEIDLSAPALVAICGPKSSRMIQELITTDPAFEFSPDPGGRWRIIERSSRLAHTSPLDDDPKGDRDVAYLARFPRAPGAPPMLVVAGVHAIGSLGAIHYLTTTDHLQQLHRTVGRHPFSIVIEAQFAQSPLAILSARTLTEPVIHRA
jgi:hypothetical protein